MSLRIPIASLVLVGAGSLGGAAVAQTAAPGYGVDELAVASGGFVGGFELLPGGNYALFDGAAVVELSADDGSLVQTLFTPASFVFGAFLTLSPDGTKLYFGESSDGKVHEIDLATLASREVLDTVFPYDLAFDARGRPFLSYALGFGTGSYVALCDFAQGTLDDVIVSADASGPLAFDAAGDLYTATPDTSSFPPPPDATEVLRFAAGDLEAGIGDGTIGTDAGELIGRVDGAAGIALDGAGDVLVTDPNYGVVVDLDPVSGVERVVATSGRAFAGFVYLRAARGTKGVFEPWQPSTGGSLLAIHSDFFTFNGITRVAPARPVITTDPPGTIPPGPFDFHVTGAVPDGLGLVLITGAAAQDEIPLGNGSWPAPLYFGLDLAGGLRVIPIATDADGELHETADNPGLGGVTLAFQLAVGERGGGPYYGTSVAVEILLQ